MSAAHATLDRLDALLADRAVQRLAPGETRELDDLLAERPDVDADAFDRAAAALDVAIAPRGEVLPAHLRQRLETQAVAWLAGRRGLVFKPGAAPGRAWLRRGAPWLLAVASVALAALSWWPEAAPPPPAAQREALLEREGTRTVAWADNEAGVRGDVVWNGDLQRGFLRIAGLPANDPAERQYQLWIFDEQRRDYGEDVAVDGGVFDIEPGEGEAVVPIDPKLPVFEPSLFAVTTEPPGGVVKHNPQLDPDRFRIVLTAPLS